MKESKKSRAEAVSVEDSDRASFTPGWNKRLSQQESLPIKLGSKVVRVLKDVVEKPAEASDAEESESEQDEVEVDEEQVPQAKAPEASDFEYVSEAVEDHQEEEVFEKERQKKAKKSGEKSEGMVFRNISAGLIRKTQQRLADICTSITTNPERSLKRKLVVEESGERIYKMTDLFEMLDSKDIQVFEMSMLSALLVFKDICPGYRIRTQEEGDTGVLKKETRALRDFELALLGSYKKYLMVLDEKVQAGLGNAKKSLSEWGPAQQLGLSALRCMCELVRSLSHFNFKSLLLAAIVGRAAQMQDDVSQLCSDTITTVLVADHQGETSYEIVRLIAKVLVTNKYDVPHRLVKCLEKVKMQVHADESKRVHQRAKRERRKRKKAGDDVEVGLLESSATADDATKRRFQADALMEVQLIYFRIIKTKVGFGLLPPALEGLGGITHLINIDTVEDLIGLMRGILEGAVPAPLLIQLLCIHCALRTLSGPGQELKIDEEFYLVRLRTLIRELPSDFERWDLVLECVSLCFIDKREERSAVVASYVKLLLVVAVHLTASSATAVLAMAHAILLRYPRTRQALAAIAGEAAPATAAGKMVVEEEDKVVDLAMRALREGNDTKATEGGLDDLDGDGSWVLPLLRLHMDGRFKHIASTLTSRDLLPLPLRIAEARYDPVGRAGDRLQAIFQSLPQTLAALKRSKENHAKLAASEAAATERDAGNPVPVAKKKSFFKKPREDKGGSSQGRPPQGKKGMSGQKGGFSKNSKHRK